jgi:bifunctional non-homologous end joining protein LigD
VPLRTGTSSDVALGWAKDVAEEVAGAAPKLATATRDVQSRSRSAVYVDYLQNVTGKSVASAFSVRARPRATISMPLAWHELESGGGDLDPTQFTIDASAAELDARGRVWRAAMRRKHRIA